jgi:hypothetical protein
MLETEPGSKVDVRQLMSRDIKNGASCPPVWVILNSTHHNAREVQLSLYAWPDLYKLATRSRTLS